MDISLAFVLAELIVTLMMSPFQETPNTAAADCRPVDPVTYEILSEKCPAVRLGL